MLNKLSRRVILSSEWSGPTAVYTLTAYVHETLSKSLSSYKLVSLKDTSSKVGHSRHRILFNNWMLVELDNLAAIASNAE